MTFTKQNWGGRCQAERTGGSNISPLGLGVLGDRGESGGDAEHNLDHGYYDKEIWGNEERSNKD